MFVNEILEKKSKNYQYNYLYSLLSNITIQKTNLLLVYLKLKNQFFKKLKKKFVLKDFFLLISLEYNRYNIFQYYISNFHFINIIKNIKKHLNKLIEFHFINVFQFINMLFLYIFEQPFCFNLNKNKKKDYNRDKLIKIFHLFFDKHVLKFNINNDIVDLTSFTNFASRLRFILFNKGYIHQNTLNYISSYDFFVMELMHFFLAFQNDYININTGIEDFVKYDPKTLTKYDYNFNEILKLPCFKFFNLSYFKDLPIFNIDFWSNLVKKKHVIHKNKKFLKCKLYYRILKTFYWMKFYKKKKSLVKSVLYLNLKIKFIYFEIINFNLFNHLNLVKIYKKQKNCINFICNKIKYNFIEIYKHEFINYLIKFLPCKKKVVKGKSKNSKNIYVLKKKNFYELTVKKYLNSNNMNFYKYFTEPSLIANSISLDFDFTTRKIQSSMIDLFNVKLNKL